MPNYDNYLMTIALLCQSETPMTAAELWKACNQQYKIPVSREKIYYLVNTADSRFGITLCENEIKPEYTLDWNEVRRAMLLPRNLIASAQSMYRTGAGSLELQKHLNSFFVRFPCFLSDFVEWQDTEVYTISLLHEILAVLHARKKAVSIHELTAYLNCRRSEREQLSEKRVRRIAEKEIPKLFFAEVTGANQHFVRLLPESQLKIYDYFTPEDVLALYTDLYSITRFF